MPEELYGETQVREIRFSKNDMIHIVLQHLKQTMDTPYNFDYERPIIIQPRDGGLILRYVQQDVTVDTESRSIRLASLEDVIQKRAEKLAKKKEI